MITKQQILNALDQAHDEFVLCWTTLSRLKTDPKAEGVGKEIFDFQVNLATALFNLETMYTSIAHEETRIINRKKHLSPSWFARYMKNLAGYKQCIKQTISVGKSLGDAFAWLFYQHDRQYFKLQHQNEKVFHTPTGVGGIGELSLIRELKFFEGNFILYHGITTFLRLGDISLIDLTRNSIVGVGELKSTMIDDKTIQITIILIGPEFNKAAKESSQQSLPLDINLDAKRMAQLERQVKRIDKSFSERKDIEHIRDEYISISHVHDLNALASNLRTDEISFHKSSDGLLLSAISYPKTRFSKKFFPDKKSIDRINIMISAYGEKARDIVNEESNDNYAIFHRIHYNDSSEPYFLRGIPPLFWWPVNLEIIRKIIFHDIHVISIFNPAYFIQKLRDAGFEVIIEDNKLLDAKAQKKTSKDGLLEITLVYLMELVFLGLINEETIIKTIQNAISTVEQKDIPKNAKVDINIEFFI